MISQRYFLLLAIVFLVSTGHSFNVQVFCKDRCMRGSGGVLCQCNAFHFAGKRTHVSPDQANAGLSLSDKPEQSAERPNTERSSEGDVDINRIINKLPTLMIEYGELTGEVDPASHRQSLLRVNNHYSTKNPSTQFHNSAVPYRSDSYLYSDGFGDQSQENGGVGDKRTTDDENNFRDFSQSGHRQPFDSFTSVKRMLLNIRKARARLHRQNESKLERDALKLLPFLVMESKDTADTERGLGSLEELPLYSEPASVFSTPLPTVDKSEDDGELTSRERHMLKLQDVISRAISKGLKSRHRPSRSVQDFKKERKVKVST